MLSATPLLIEPKEPSTLWLAQVMARGWESKAVESQIEAARSDQAASSEERLTPDKADAHRTNFLVPWAGSERSVEADCMSLDNERWIG